MPVKGNISGCQKELNERRYSDDDQAYEELQFHMVRNIKYLDDNIQVDLQNLEMIYFTYTNYNNIK